ncbi:MAG: hypothetical protein IJG60_04955 [Thermoguttaceae bacterium]|jgi:hypothetical protein|nr:hypothetical protein [Thermoguttaceae bacterium]
MGRFIGCALLFAALAAVSGCDAPEVPRSEYGQTVDELPDFPHASPYLPLPEEVLSDLQKTELR